jgi:hypothetical protein
MGNDGGFLKLRRGFDEHLDGIDGDSLKLYLRLLFLADWRKGKNYGLVVGNLSEMVQSFRWSPDKLSRKFGDLEKRYIAVEHRGNQFAPSIFRILKYDKGALRKNADSTPSALRKSAESTTEHSAKTPAALRTDADSSPQKCGVHSRERLENTEVKRSEEGLRSKDNKERKKNKPSPSIPSISLTAKIWQEIGLNELPETARAFVSLVEQAPPTPGERAQAFLNRIVAICKRKSPPVDVPRRFYAVLLSKIDLDSDVVLVPKPILSPEEIKRRYFSEINEKNRRLRNGLAR